MAPEQAKGKPVDRRADIWAFGVVLYEMLTGRRAYEGEDVSDTLAAVLTRDVDWNALPTDVPPRLIALLRDCLVRDPKQRLRDIGEARRVLDQIIAGVPDPAAVIASAQSQARAWISRALPWSVAAIALAGAARSHSSPERLDEGGIGPPAAGPRAVAVAGAGRMGRKT